MHTCIHTCMHTCMPAQEIYVQWYACQGYETQRHSETKACARSEVQCVLQLVQQGLGLRYLWIKRYHVQPQCRFAIDARFESCHIAYRASNHKTTLCYTMSYHVMPGYTMPRYQDFSSSFSRNPTSRPSPKRLRVEELVIPRSSHPTRQRQATLLGEYLGVSRQRFPHKHLCNSMHVHM